MINQLTVFSRKFKKEVVCVSDQSNPPNPNVMESRNPFKLMKKMINLTQTIKMKMITSEMEKNYLRKMMEPSNWKLI